MDDRLKNIFKNLYTLSLPDNESKMLIPISYTISESISLDQEGEEESEESIVISFVDVDVSIKQSTLQVVSYSIIDYDTYFESLVPIENISSENEQKLIKLSGVICAEYYEAQSRMHNAERSIAVINSLPCVKDKIPINTKETSLLEMDDANIVFSDLPTDISSEIKNTINQIIFDTMIKFVDTDLSNESSIQQITQELLHKANNALESSGVSITENDVNVQHVVEQILRIQK